MTKSKQPHTTNHHDLEKRFGDIVFQRDSEFGKITVGNNAFDLPGNKVLFINHRDMCHSKMNLTEQFLGRIAKHALPDNAHVLNIGLGCGFTASVIAESSSVKCLDLVEINSVIVDACRHFDTENGELFNRNNINVIVEDGVEWVAQCKTCYDAIVLDIEEPSVKHAEPVYGHEFFRKVKQKIRVGGVCAVWVLFTSQKFVQQYTQMLNEHFNFATAYRFQYGEDENFGSLVVCGSDVEMINYEVLLSEDELFYNNMTLTSLSLGEVNTDSLVDDEAMVKHFDVKKAFNFSDDYDE